MSKNNQKFMGVRVSHISCKDYTKLRFLISLLVTSYRLLVIRLRDSQYALNSSVAGIDEKVITRNILIAIKANSLRTIHENKACRIATFL